MATYLGELIQPNFSPLLQSHAFISLGHSASSPTNLMHWWTLNQKRMRQNCCTGVSQDFSIYSSTFLCQRLLQSSVHWMRMMAVEVKSDLSLCQWFLWLQVDQTFCKEKYFFPKINIFQLGSCGLRWAKSSSVFFNSVSIFFQKGKVSFWLCRTTDEQYSWGDLWCLGSGE